MRPLQIDKKNEAATNPAQISTQTILQTLKRSPMKQFHAPYLLALLLSFIGISINQTFAQVSGTKP